MNDKKIADQLKSLDGEQTKALVAIDTARLCQDVVASKDRRQRKTRLLATGVMSLLALVTATATWQVLSDQNVALGIRNDRMIDNEPDNSQTLTEKDNRIAKQHSSDAKQELESLRSELQTLTEQSRVRSLAFAKQARLQQEITAARRQLGLMSKAAIRKKLSRNLNSQNLQVNF